MRIRTKFYSAITMMFFVGLSMFGATAFISSEQSGDGLVINLAGRQRMLSHKLAKEAFACVQFARDGKDTDSIRGQLKTTSALFEKTLSALLSGGPAPTGTNPDGPLITLP